MESTDKAAHENVARAAFIHREIVQLAVLVAAALAAFVVTRAVAASNRDMSLRDAAEWYRRGQEDVRRGHLDDAIAAFRRATVRDRTDRQYVLALARALALHRDDEAARGALLTLREATPEDPEVNLELARLAAGRQDVTEALRFYHNALYAPWPLDQTEARRRIRIELIRFLTAHDQSRRALAELLALSSDLPDDVPHHLEAARLFIEAGDRRHALEQFQRALRLAPENADALSGAGVAAFQLGEYSLAHEFLRHASLGGDEVTRTRELVDLVLSNDPLAARLGSSERRRRFRSDFDYARERLDACLSERGGGGSDSLTAIQTEAQAFDDRITPGTFDQDDVEAGVDLIIRIEETVIARCGPARPRDQALILIGREHGAGTP